MHFSTAPEYRSDPDPSCLSFTTLPWRGLINISTPPVSGECDEDARVSTMQGVCIMMWAHTQALEWLRRRASSTAQCSQCARCAAFNQRRCATGPSGLPNSPPQHCRKWSRILLNRERGTEGEREVEEGKEVGGSSEREIKNKGKVQ